MPTYAYRCRDCGHQFDIFQKFSDDALTTCPVCAGTIRRVIQPTGVVFKGTGFYINDSKTSGKAAPAKASAEGESGDAPAEKAKEGPEKKDTAATSDAPATTDGVTGSKPEKAAAAPAASSTTATGDGKTAARPAAKRN